MKISVTEPNPKSYNASILSVDKYEKTVAKAVHNVFVNTALDLPSETILSWYTWELLTDLILDVQALFFILSNWDKSYNKSSFTLPEEEEYTGPQQVQEDPTVKAIDRNRITVASDDEDDLLRTANNGITIIAKNSLDIDKGMHSFLYDTVATYEEGDYIEFITLILYIQYVVELLFATYNYARGDGGKFALLMKLRSRQNAEIINKIPKFPKIPQTCLYDFEWIQKIYPTVCKLPEEPSQMLWDKYNVEPWFYIDKIQPNSATTSQLTPSGWFENYTSWGNGFFWRVSDESTIVNGVNAYKVKGYWSGYDDEIMSQAFFTFEGYIQTDIPEEDFSFEYTNNGAWRIRYFVYVTRAKGLVQTVEIIV